MAYQDNKNRSGYPSRDTNPTSQNVTLAYGREKKIPFDMNWITTGITDDCITFAEGFGSHLEQNKFTTSQIRNVFGEIKRIQMSGFGNQEAKTDFLLLKPKMAYAAKRAGNTGAADFERVMKLAHEAVKAKTENDVLRFKNFCDFIEAILAYHKAAGGRD